MIRKKSLWGKKSIFKITFFHLNWTSKDTKTLFQLFLSNIHTVSQVLFIFFEVYLNFDQKN